MSLEKQFKHGIRFAWHVPSQRMVMPGEVDKGLACNCLCVACDARLIARQGDLRIWHFAHHKEANCPHALEAAIHWMAKQMISDRKELFVPQRTLSKTIYGKSRVWSDTLIVNVQHPGVHPITDCQIEKNIGGPATEVGYRRPDLVAQLEGRPVAIEIHNTHAVDPTKALWLEQQGFSVLEIDVGDLATLPTDAYKAALEHRLFAIAENSHWLAHMGDVDARTCLDQLEQKVRLAKKPEEDELVALLQAREAAARNKAEFLKRFRDVEQFKIRCGFSTLRIGRNEDRATLKAYGHAPDVLFSKVIHLARQLGGKFNAKGQCWEFYRHGETKAFFDKLCVKLKEIIEPIPSNTIQDRLQIRQSIPSRVAPPVSQVFANPALQEMFDERAAILEYGGQLSREDAEQQALRYISNA